MFNKKDFQNGMVIEMNDGTRRLLWNGKFIDEHGYISLSNLNNDLYDLDTTNHQYVVKVFLTHDVCYLKDFLKDDSLTCIWDRYN